MAAFPLATRLSGAPAEPLDEFTSDLVAARLTVAHLARWARRYLLTMEGGDDCCCPAGSCRLAQIPGGHEACRLAKELAWLPLADGGAVAHRAAGNHEELTLLYLAALRGAGDAVHYCQRIQHVLGDCWFSGSGMPGEELCAKSLTAAHLLQSARRVL